MENKKRKGFTLPEILAVVAILILLVGIAIPGYERLTQKSDVSDALHNLEMLSSAQNKYFVANGRYTRNLSSLETPLKDDPSNINPSVITTANFTYSATAASSSREKYCIFSESKKNNYVLAYNYQTNVGPICSGSFCSQISDIVPQGSIAELCGKEYDGGECDITECASGTHLDEQECACVCDLTCGNFATVGDAKCSCRCIGQAVQVSDNNLCAGAGCTYNCECPASVKTNCEKSGHKFDSAKCDCTDCDLAEEDCTAIGKVLNTSKCVCEEALNHCNKVCPVGKVLNKETCQCECSKTAHCPGNQIFSQETCKCECSYDESTCAAQGKVFDKKNCACACSTSQINSCSSPYQELQSDCSCQCNKPTNYNKVCEQNFAWNDDMCGCKCNLKQSDCPTKGYVVDPKSCTCVLEGECSLTDADCQEGYIANTTKCVCEESTCLVHEVCPNGTWDYRNCECVCGLTAEYCKEHGNRLLDENNCECTSCSTMEKECTESNKVLNPSNCSCECTSEAETACQATPYLSINDADCSCVCNTPSPNPCQGHAFFNSSVDVCECECGYACTGDWELNAEKCDCTCPLDADKCKEQNKNYVYNNEQCRCDCGLDAGKCTSQNANYTFNSSQCKCDCGLTNESCQSSSGNQYYGVNNDTSCQCACSSDLLDKAVSTLNSPVSGRKGPFWQADYSNCQPTCPVTGDDWCVANYGKKELADTGNCTCYTAQCPNEQKCPNGHFNYRECQCVCDLDETACSLQGKVYDSSDCSCKDPCPLNQAECVSPFVFHPSQFNDCSCDCGLTNDDCYADHGKVLDNEKSCTCVCGNECGDGYLLRNSDCECVCNKDNNWCKTHNENNEHYVFNTDGSCGCHCDLTPEGCGGGNWTVTGSCTCSCPDSVKESCTNSGKGFDATHCQCTGCTTPCSHPHQVQNPDTCGCSECDSLVCSGNWVKDPDTCDCTCPASVKTSCENQHKAYNAETCSCGACTNSCPHPHQVQDPDTCGCSTCDGLVCSGNWQKDPDTCECTICPASVKSSCEAQGKEYNAGTCSCGECTPQSCGQYKELNPSSCECECSETLLNQAVSSLGGEWTANMGTCQPSCPVTGQSWCTSHYDANHVPSTGGNNCSCVCGGNDTCSAQHGGNTDWHMNGSCGCECSITSTTCQQRNSNINYMVNDNCECVCNTSASCGAGKHLNTGTCQCECNTQLACGTNKDEDPSTCGCGECKLTSCPAGKVLVETETDCYCDDSCKVDCTSPKIKQDEPCGCVCGSYSRLSNNYASCPDGTAPNNTDCTCECSSSCPSPKELNNSCDCVCPYYTKQGDATHYNSCPSGFTTNSANCTCDCNKTCKSGETLHSDTCSCSCDKSPSGNIIVDSNCEYQCRADLEDECIAQGRPYLGYPTCACGSCNAQSCGQYQEQNMETCDCECSHTLLDNAVAELNSHGGTLNNGANWVADYSTCQPSCPSSVSTECANHGTYYLSGSCDCGECIPKNCGADKEQDMQDCECYCTLDDSTCISRHGENWRANTGNCTCQCDHAAVDSAVSAKGTITSKNNWVADYGSACGPVCPASVQSSCEEQGKVYDAANCKCGSCESGCPHPHQVQNPNDCDDCSKCDDLVCTGNRLKDPATCDCYCPSSVQEDCEDQGREYNSSTCGCGSCTPIDCGGYWTQNSSTCECTVCTLEDSTCVSEHGANWVANNSTGHCECECNLTDASCAEDHGGNANWIADGCTQCVCSPSAKAECDAKGKAFIFDAESCECRCAKAACPVGQDINPSTCECGCKKNPGDCTLPFVLNNKSCECECGKTDSECPGDWGVNTTLCDCSECNLTNSICAKRNGGNTNYIANKTVGHCECECGLKSCPGEKELSGCNCVCNKTQQECDKLGTGYTLNNDTCTCEKTDPGVACEDPWVPNGSGGCECSLTEEYCNKLGMALIVNWQKKRCECVDNGTSCTLPWIPCDTEDSVSGCCCGKKSTADCPAGTTFNGTICACVENNTLGCTGNFVQVGNQCVCVLTEEYCSKLGKRLYTNYEKNVCECREIGDVPCYPPWTSDGNGGCTCTINPVSYKKCPSGYAPISSTSRCGCYCKKVEAVDCPESTYLDQGTCTCVPISQCPKYKDVDCHEGYYNFSTCSCVCDIDTSYCKNAYTPGRVFDPATCTCQAVSSTYFSTKGG